jgi:hypothetical protein
MPLAYPDNANYLDQASICCWRMAITGLAVEVLACQEVKSNQVRAFLLSGPSISRARWYRTSAGCFLLLFYTHITFIKTFIGRSSAKSTSSPHPSNSSPEKPCLHQWSAAMMMR